MAANPQQSAVLIYIDGADPNPGAGGYGVVFISGRHREELSAGYRLTTNNRMELLAVVAGLEMLIKPRRGTVFSDSQDISTSIARGSLPARQVIGC